ncbi:hypothetical protein J3R83DRAFT_5518 [Lanmaoa asiatica]|nr:hypothetical protein J3R83DRAFT_5518 [Lanmaoa asiatica]
MVRTKQTAKKSTGIEAPRITIKIVPKRQAAAAVALLHERPVEPNSQGVSATPNTPDQARFVATLTAPPNGNGLGNNDHERPAMPLGASAIPNVPDRTCLAAMLAAPPNPDSHANNDFCNMCGDGGHLFNCDSCPRATCHQCLSIPVQHLALILDDNTTFLCISCHWKDDVRSGKVTPYMGFYRDGAPILPTFLTVTGDFQLPIRSGISSHHTVVIHLRVHTLPPDGPVLMLQHFLQPYFAHSGHLIVKDLAFNLTTVATRKQYTLDAARILSELGDIHGHNILFTLTAHSEDDRGDLTLGMSRQKKTEVTSTVDAVLEVLLTPFEKITSKAIFIMFACGAIVNKRSSFKDFCDAITQFGFSSAIAFDAVRLHPSTCWPFVVFLIEAMFIEQHDVEAAVPHALGHSNKLGQHSGVYLFARATDCLKITKYFWAHRDFRPWGHILPPQCPFCGSPQQWKRKMATDHSYTFKCRYRRCGFDPKTGKKAHPRGKLEFRKPEGAKVILQGKTRVSGWLSLDVSSA